jgi:hypothetical protein
VATTGWRPEVVLDVEVRSGCIVLVLENTGTASAYAPRVRFEPEVVGLGGELAVSKLPVWSTLAVLRPGHPVEVVLGTSADADQRFTAHIGYVDVDGQAYETSLTHDLRTHRERTQPR